MITLYLMEGWYINTEEELDTDNSGYGVTAVYNVDISEEEYQKLKYAVSQVIKESYFSNSKLPQGYTRQGT